MATLDVVLTELQAIGRTCADTNTKLVEHIATEGKCRAQVEEHHQVLFESMGPIDGQATPGLCDVVRSQAEWRNRLKHFRMTDLHWLGAVVVAVLSAAVTVYLKVYFTHTP